MMAQVRKFFILLVINIFAMLMVTILYEYINLAERFQTLEQTIQIAVESSVDASYGAEELFSSKYDINETSDGTSASSRLNNNLLICTDGDFYSANIYSYARYFDNNILGKSPYYRNNTLIALPSGATVRNNICSDAGNTEAYFRWLYGEVGCPIYINFLRNSWWGMSNSSKNNYLRLVSSSKISSNDYTREPTTEFKAFYDAVGKYVTSTVNVKERDDTTSSFKLVQKEVPVLANMGLMLHDYNNWNSRYSLPNYISSVKVGKKELSNNAISYSVYYLTPYSLGVTYIPTKVLYPTLLNNINTVVSLNKLAGATLLNSNQIKQVTSSAKGCINTEVYTNGGNTNAQHISANDELIVNDGAIEYDLSSLRVAVDYVVVDFADWKTNQSKQELLSRIEGCINNVAYSVSSNPRKVFSTTQSYYYNSFSQLGRSFGSNPSKPTKRVVARVTVQIKVHVCYDSSILQWCCQRFTGGASEHYDIKGYNSTSNSIIPSADGVWYEYTTYRCHAN